jgi:multiple sugar transport system substrate-binding protein
MEKKTNVFQIVIIAVFIFITVVSVIVFAAGGKGGSNKNVGGSVVIWGPFPQNAFISPIAGMADILKETGISVSYVEKDFATYEAGLVEAFASGTGPDVFVLTPDLIIKHKNKIFEVPFTSFPIRSYETTYVDGAKVFVTNTGVLGFPFGGDPLMLYYNKDMLNNAGYVTPPQTWSELSGMTSRLVSLDENRQITKASVAFGQFGNITNASEILQALMLQLGNPITQFDREQYQAVFSSQTTVSGAPAQTAFGFFTQFSNPAGDLYSWNSILPTSRDMFIQGRLAFYVGFASELTQIQRQNVNLNFDMTAIPQREGADKKVTYARMYAFALSKQGKNINSAFSAASNLANGTQASVLAKNLGLGVVRRELLAIKSPENRFSDIVNASMLTSYSWVNPDKKEIDQYLKDAIDSVVRGVATPAGAVSDTQLKIQALLNNL